MAEYIEREVAIKCIESQCVDGKMWGNDESEGTLIEAYSAIDDLMDIPAADVAPVVRCEDCKHLCVWNQKDIYAFCPKTNIVFLPFDKDTRTFFCSYGERKEKANES